MSTYLYTWNPKRWKWVDQPEAICRIGAGEQYDMYWSCGNTKKIAVGDTFFLMKLGVEPKGIIGCGYVSSSPGVSEFLCVRRGYSPTVMGKRISS